MLDQYLSLRSAQISREILFLHHGFRHHHLVSANTCPRGCILFLASVKKHCSNYFGVYPSVLRFRSKALNASQRKARCINFPELRGAYFALGQLPGKPVGPPISIV